MERNEAVVAYIDGKCYDGKVLRQVVSKGTYLVRVNDLGIKEVKEENILAVSEINPYDYKNYCRNDDDLEWDKTPTYAEYVEHQLEELDDYGLELVTDEEIIDQGLDPENLDYDMAKEIFTPWLIFLNHVI